MRKGYKTTLSFLGILIVLCAFVGIAYLFYDKVSTDKTFVEVDGELSINYLSGKKISGNGIYDFSVTNNSSKDFYYEIAIYDITNYDANLKYSLISSDANININNLSLDKDATFLADNILITSGQTEDFTLTITNNETSSFKIAINKLNDEEEFFFTTILNNNEVKKNPLTKPDVDIATDNEGLIEDVDDYGVTYYFRGNVLNNYVNFANLTWRIVRINGDGTVKLILDDVTNELTNYSSSLDNGENFENTDINNNLKSFYDNHLKDYDNYIANTKYCLETAYEVSEAEKIYYTYSRVAINLIPTFNCLGDTYTSKIGLITADEAVFAGATTTTDNTNYYLYNENIGDIWWLLSLATSKDEEIYPFSISKEGKLTNEFTGTLYRNLRPTISLNKKVEVSGSGTKEDPYTLN